MQTLKAIIFDVDGTLANTEETHRQAFNSAFEEFNLNFFWSESEYAELLAISGGRERLHVYFKNHRDAFPCETNLRELSLLVHRRKSEIYREKLIVGQIGFRCGIKRLIDEARERGIKLAIATASSKANVETLLKNNLGDNALDIFEVIVTCDIVQDKKPSPAAYQFALAELGLEPDVCIAIEDTSNGRKAAQAAGLKTIITTHAFTTDDDFDNASLVVDQLGEPNLPFIVETGENFGRDYVDIDLIDSILSSDAESETESDWNEPVLSVAK
jgi:HAD superfamily hydrolase (TIGR01509 family)